MELISDNSLTGAILMDFFEGEELKVEENRVIPSLRINNDSLHALFSEQFSKSSRNRKISYWIRRLTNKSRFIFREMTLSLEKQGVLRIEQKRFLNIFPYRRYRFLNISVRTEIKDHLREVLLHATKPDKKDLMLISVLQAAGAHSILKRERGETKTIRQKSTALLKSALITSEISQTVKDVQSAISSAITAEIIIVHGG
jgi:translation initiation factor 2 beta subunit (eIF-2beta)/eIF-5